MKKLFISLSFLAISCMVTAQSDYDKALGIRLTPASYYDFLALSYKDFISDAGALEFSAGAGVSPFFVDGHIRRPFTLSISGAYQHHFSIPVNGLQWFVGGGLTAYNAIHGVSKARGFGFGFFPTGGIDWKIPNVALNLTADYRPTIFITRPDIGNSFEAAQFGLAIRYVIGGK